MDTSLLNLEEHFATYYVSEDRQDVSNSPDNHRRYFSEWEDEREINGDIGLIPETSSFSESLKEMSDITDSPPSVLFHKMIDWPSLIFVDGVESLSHDAVSNHLTDQIDKDFEDKNRHTSDCTESKNTFNDKDNTNFDLTTYILEPTFNDQKLKIKSIGKKIDREAQRYVVEDKNDKLDTSDEVDVETVLDGASLPVLEANDALGLLEQFEASEKPVRPAIKQNENLDATCCFGFSSSLANNIEMAVNHIPISPVEIFEKIPQTPMEIFEDESKVSRHESLKTEKKTDEEKNTSIVKTFNKSDSSNISGNSKLNTLKPQTSEKNNAHIYVKNKQILDALPQELIARINESGKRKTITVIPPIPTKKRTMRSNDNVSQNRNKIAKTGRNEQIQFDHDYCVASSPYPKEPQKDSGFQSSEEDDRSVIRNQPTVKTADGKLMVSLLKVNTVRNTNNASNNSEKKKLNLEEYKKRRFIGSNNTSLNNSPISSTCSSPLPEDENLKRIKHQEKLMKMAADLLKTSPKSTKLDNPLKKIKTHDSPENKSNVSGKIIPPPDLEVKTYVSIATNTDISSINSNKSQQLEEIKPLLQKVSDKINSSSFITSLIQNIPKVNTKPGSYVKSENEEIVRENKIIHYLKKDRLPVKTSSVSSQTEFDTLDFDSDTQSRYRRRIKERRTSSSSSSGSSPRSTRRRRRSSSCSSRHSHTSHSSDSSSSYYLRSSRSRSRSLSPKISRHYSAEHLREVEERRVIYVGRITKGTTKEDLRRRFLSFGPITNISLHFREYGDNYGFVTFVNKEDAYEAVEHGNDGHVHPKYDLSFGGRRIFCKTSYSDLDNMREEDYSHYQTRAPENSFDALLRAAQEKLRKRKS